MRPLDGFPVRTVGPAVDLYRCHRMTRGPWWFGSSGDGRFDLAPPRGSCYLALSVATAVREAIGPELSEFGYITAGFAGDRHVSRVRLPRARDVADLTAAGSADFGVTRELCTMTPYDIPHQWATALANVSDGVHYETRFSTDPNATALALFDAMGDPGWPWPGRRESVGLAVAARRCGVEVRQPPSSVTIVPPPA